MGVFYLICWRRNYPQDRGTRPRSLRDHLSLRICFPGLFAGHKDNEWYLRLTEKLLCEQRRNL